MKHMNNDHMKRCLILIKKFTLLKKRNHFMYQTDKINKFDNALSW